MTPVAWSNVIDFAIVLVAAMVAVIGLCVYGLRRIRDYMTLKRYRCDWGRK